MRSVDLALYADALAGEAAALAARAELPRVVVERFGELGLLATRGDAETLAALEESLDALEALQAWVEELLSRAAA